jgi:branched-chain amino acid transport system substrate-binding protein
VSQFDRRRVLQLLGGVGAAGLFAPALAACGSGSGSSASTSRLKVGMIVPQTGANKAIGTAMANGFRLYLGLNDNTLGGHPVDLVTADEGETAAAAKAAADKLVRQSGAQVLTGVASTTAMIALRDQIEAAQVPLIGSNASPATALGVVNYIWRTSYVNNEAGEALGVYVAQNLHAQGPVFIVSDDSPSAQDEVTGFVTSYQGLPGHLDFAADPLVVPASADPNISYHSAINAIRNSSAKVVFAFFAGNAAVNFVKAFHSAGLNAALYAPGFLTEGTMLAAQGNSANGIFTALNYSADLDNNANQTFAAAYQKAYKTAPSTYAMASYDAGAVLDMSLQLAGTDVSPRGINAAIGRIGEIDSPRGTWQFNQTRTPLQKWYLRQVRKDGAVLANVLLSDLSTLG